MKVVTPPDPQILKQACIEVARSIYYTLAAIRRMGLNSPHSTSSNRHFKYSVSGRFSTTG